MSSTSEASIIREGSSPRRPSQRPDRFAYRGAVSIILPSEGRRHLEIGQSDAFGILFGETIDLADGVVRLWTEVPLEPTRAILQFEWPQRGPVMLSVAMEPMGERHGFHVQEARVLEVL